MRRLQNRTTPTLLLAFVFAAPLLGAENTAKQETRHQSVLADIGPAPSVALTDAAGKPFVLADLRGKAVVVSFVYTTCTGSCPATTFNLTRVQRALKEAGLWSTQVEFVSISLDPERDTPEALAAYARNYNADPVAWHFLTGPPDRVAKVVAAWGMWAKIGPSGTLDHPSRIFLIDPQGRQREIYNLEFLKPASVLHDVQTVLAESANR
ncbi:protein SCO1/2 [Singulisphaera sp. GP187]|uniref:SCO family protein n=1 Tax=Singulisphaera sp. GP187 TaxID=1882752 RepID=UPI00092CB965|nr:SCO family protein [Singulisphaera sp. GP187]SIO43005.1 protein SCO1/2 [Singulisphaera sp. GP187]